METRAELKAEPSHELREGWLANRSSRERQKQPAYALRATAGNLRLNRERRLVAQNSAMEPHSELLQKPPPETVPPGTIVRSKFSAKSDGGRDVTRIQPRDVD